MVCTEQHHASTTVFLYERKLHMLSNISLLCCAQVNRYLGDVVTTTAQRYLREMGVMKEVIDEGKTHFITNGGFVSPCGNSFVGDTSTETQPQGNYNQYNRGAVATIKRVVLDEKMVAAAQRMGSVLVEGVNIVDASFSRISGIWTLEGRVEGPATVYYKARALVCADGAPSKLARNLGIIQTDPNAVCSRAYVVPPYPFKWDVVMFYPRSLLPGNCAIVREAGDELNYLTYIISGGLVKEEDLARLHHEFIKKDPYISQALGPAPVMERMKAASLRVGGVGKSYADHVLVVGDAAGFVDPHTGLGIQYAIEGGKFAASTLLEGFSAGDLSSQFLQNYQTRWMRAFGGDFYWSMKMTFFLYRFPIVFDATAKLIQRRGSRFFMEWVRAITGARRKTWFFRPDVFPFLFFEVIVELVRRQFSRRR